MRSVRFIGLIFLSAFASATALSGANARPIGQSEINDVMGATVAVALWLSAHAKEPGAEAKAMELCTDAEATAAKFDFSVAAAGMIAECKAIVYEEVNKKALACSHYKSAAAHYRRAAKETYQSYAERQEQSLKSLGC